MHAFLTILIALVCLLLMGAVLIQNPKGGGLDSTFGGSANQMLGAAKSADFIEKATWALAIALFVLCIITAITLGSGGDGGEDNGLRSTGQNEIEQVIDFEVKDIITYKS